MHLLQELARRLETIYTRRCEAGVTMTSIGKVEPWHDLGGVHPALFRVPVSFDSGLLVFWLHNNGDLFGCPSTAPNRDWRFWLHAST
jgi:hypothetical protein